MQRYFLKKINGEFLLEQEDIFHIEKVMRARIGDHFEIVDDQSVKEVEITSLKPLNYQEISRRPIQKNKYPIILFYCLPKGDKMELVLQKATELGIHEVYGVISSRTIVRLEKKDQEKKKVRYQKIMKEASEQCLRDDIPTFQDIIDFKSLKNYHFDHMLIAYEGEKGNTHHLYEEILKIKPGEKTAILIGAEGGFSKEEVEFVTSLGYLSISLGKRILRSETAAIASIAFLSLLLERDE